MDFTARALIYGLLAIVLVTPSFASVASVPQNNYTVTSGNVVCVVMTAGIQLTIPYIGKAKNLTTTVSIPPDAVSNGVCKKEAGMDVLSISFNKGWQLSIAFRNTSGTSYQWRQVSLTYKTDPKYFPNISTSSVNMSITQNTHLPNGTMLTKTSGSYACPVTILQLNGSISMNVSTLQYRALGTNSTTGFSTTGVQHCSLTMSVPDTDVALAVSVGIALGACIVAAVLLYIIGSRIIARKTGYELT